MNPPEYTSLPTRFWDKVEVNEVTGCWEWTARTNWFGYGLFQFAHKGKPFRSHRLAAADVAPIPEGLYVLHHCDNPPCVRPIHLHNGTARDNAADMVTRSRQAIGSDNGNSKLTECAVVAIRNDYASGRYNQRELGNIHGVNQTKISSVIRRETWSHVR